MFKSIFIGIPKKRIIFDVVFAMFWTLFVVAYASSKEFNDDLV